MTGIVMEREKNKVIVMTKGGQFLEVKRPNNSLNIGEEIIIGNNKNQFAKRLVSVAAALIFVLTGSYGVYGYYAPYGYVNVDINPSVQMTYNLYDRVIKLEGLNEDGNQVVDKIKDFKNKSIDAMINKIVDEAIEEEFIKPTEENLVLITIVEKNKEIDNTEIYQSVNDHIKETKVNTELMVLEVDKKTYDSVAKHKISHGKTVLVNRALELNEDLKFDDISQKSNKEIVKIIRESAKHEVKVEKKEKKKLGEQDVEEKAKEKEKREKDKEGKAEEKDKEWESKGKSNKKEAKDRTKERETKEKVRAKEEEQKGKDQEEDKENGKKSEGGRDNEQERSTNKNGKRRKR